MESALYNSQSDLNLNVDALNVNAVAVRFIACGWFAFVIILRAGISHSASAFSSYICDLRM